MAFGIETPAKQPPGPLSRGFSKREPVFESERDLPGEAPHDDMQIPSGEPEEERPKSSTRSLVRLIAILVFFLVPFFNSIVRKVSLNTPSGPPVLREVLFCEDVSEGLPVNPKDSFSVGRDEKIVAYTRWSGSRGQHDISVRWFTPQGNLHTNPPPVMRYEEGSNSITASSFLLLQRGMPLGNWRAEVFLDQQKRAEMSFQLHE